MDMSQESFLSVEEALKSKMSKESTYDLRIEHSLQFPEPPALPGNLISGVLRYGHKMVLAGPPDAGKTSLLLSLGLAVSQGANWLGLATSRAHVLFVNLELESTSLINRLHQVAAASGLSASDKSFHFINHRGGNLDPARFAFELRQLLVKSKLEGIEFKLVIIDPIYKIIGMGGTDESSNLRASRLISGLGDIAEIGDVAFVLCADIANDHPRYQVTHEVENGVGQLARDADTLLTLWPLERRENSYRLKGQMREFESFPPMSLTFTFPVFQAAPDLDRIPIVGSEATEAETAEDAIADVNIWKVWDKLNPKEAISVDELAKLMNMSAFEAREKIKQAPPNPLNPKMKLRLTAGNKIKAEEE